MLPRGQHAGNQEEETQGPGPSLGPLPSIDQGMVTTCNLTLLMWTLSRAIIPAAVHLGPAADAALDADLVNERSMPYSPRDSMGRHVLLEAYGAVTIFQALNNFMTRGLAYELPRLFPCHLGMVLVVCRGSTAAGALLDPQALHAESGGDNSKLLPADGKLAAFRKELADPTDRMKHKAFFSFRWLVSALCKKHSFQVVLVDLGPSNDELNRMILNSCDVILPSFRPDYYGWSSFNQLLVEGEDRHGIFP